MNYNFPNDLYTDVRIEERKSASYYLKGDQVEGNSEVSTTGAMIRVFDGKMWYTSETNNLENIQKEIDNLASLAKPNPNILKNPVVKNFSVNKASVLKFEGDDDFRNLTLADREKIVNDYKKACVDTTVNIEEIKLTHVLFSYSYKKKSYYTSKGSEIIQDYQRASIQVAYELSVNNVPYAAMKDFREFSFAKLQNRYDEVLEELNRTLDFAKNAKPIEPGEYQCVLSPSVTSVFTHESFGHKSEADFMLNDETLRNEWVMGKKVGNEKVSICDDGDIVEHGYMPYDDEGNRKTPTWLIKNGILTGRLHDAKSAAALKEKPTGNSRAQDYTKTPIVRMTNTYMAAGTDDPEKIISEVKDGIYVYDWNYGTGQSTFTIQPRKCYRIRDGKICEPVKVNVVTGSVFQALFDIDAVGNDLEFFSGTCGKMDQSVNAGTGGPTIRVKKLMFN